MRWAFHLGRKRSSLTSESIMSDIVDDFVQTTTTERTKNRYLTRELINADADASGFCNC